MKNIIKYYLYHFFARLFRRKFNIFAFILICLFIITYKFYLPKEAPIVFNHDASVNVENGEALKIFTLKSKCNCRKDLTIKKYASDKYSVNNKYFIKSYAEPSSTLANGDKVTTERKYDDYINNYTYSCNLYNVLRRGPNQRVIGFSIYGSNVNYYKPLLNLTDAIKKYFPGWIVRVHHTTALDQSVACDFECKEDIIDFCNTDEMPYEIGGSLLYYKGSYPHAMMWRWYPIGDDFVDYFMSRDSDSVTIQREKDSVDVWLNERKNTLFHVMRDNPYHNVHILGGMWGYANIRNRELGKRIFRHMLTSDIEQRYNPGGQNLKGLDQSYLSDHVWKDAKENATIHDSYNCKFLGGDPFPTQRPDDRFCFAACFLPCCDVNLKQTQRMPVCPIECRPKDHQDWLTC